jgi:hypothetical protein
MLFVNLLLLIASPSAQAQTAQSVDAFARAQSLTAPDQQLLLARIQKLHPTLTGAITCRFQAVTKESEESRAQLAAGLAKDQLALKVQDVSRKTPVPAFQGKANLVNNWDETLRNLAAGMADDLRQGYRLETIDFQLGLAQDYKITPEQFYRDLEKIGIRREQVRLKKQQNVYSYMPVPVRNGISQKTQYLLVRILSCTGQAVARPEPALDAPNLTGRGVILARDLKQWLSNCVIDVAWSVIRQADGHLDVAANRGAYTGPHNGSCTSTESNHWKQSQCGQIAVTDRSGNPLSYNNRIAARAEAFPLRFRFQSLTKEHYETVTVSLSPDGNRVTFRKQRI